jgi:energy-coupling factor transporter ATP-binding protein EcfA2
MEPEPPIIAKTALGGGIVLSHEERKRHVYVVGKSGSGKSTLLFNLAMHDIHAGAGVCVLDPHGDLADAIVDAMPRFRMQDTCYLNVADTEHPVGFNPLAQVPPRRRALAAAGIVATCKHVWGAQSWGPRLEYFLYNGVAALLESPYPTLLDLSRLYTDETFRARLTARITDPVLARFWTHEFPSYDERFQTEAASPILNKIGQITASPTVRNILCQVSPKFDLAYAMDNRRILIANLAKGQIGEQASSLLGSLLLSHLQLIAMRRSEVTEDQREPFFVHVDELQSFGTEAFASLLSEARKFATHFCLANQYTEQLSPMVRAAVLGNAGTLFVFRVSAADADLLAPEFHPLPAPELMDQAPYRAWLRRVEAGHRVAFVEPPRFSSRNARIRVIATSRRKFGRPQAVIERSSYPAKSP